MKKLVVLLTLIFFMYSHCFANSYYETYEDFQIDGSLKYITDNNNFYERYKKSIDLNCNKLTKACELLTATYVDDSSHSLYPNKYYCELVSNLKDRKIVFCPSNTFLKIDVSNKKLIFEIKC